MPRYTQSRRTWHYLNEFKVKAVQLSLLDGVQVQEVARTLDIHPFMLSRWRKEYREGKLVADKRKKVIPMAKDKKKLSRMQELEKENARLRQENDLLKCGNGISRRHIRTIWIHPEIRTRPRSELYVRLAQGLT